MKRGSEIPWKLEKVKQDLNDRFSPLGNIDVATSVKDAPLKSGTQTGGKGKVDRNRRCNHQEKKIDVFAAFKIII